MADGKRLQRTLQQLFDSQPDDERLRDHLEGLVRDEAFPGLTWFWGPALYRRNRVVFRGMILNRFSDWVVKGWSWRHVAWQDHADRLQPWLDAARANRDVNLVRRLLRWKYSADNGRLDTRRWNAALLADYQAAPSAAARAVVLEEHDDWFELDEDTALELYGRDRVCGPFIIKHLPYTFWGEERRKLWSRLSRAALEARDDKLHDELYRRQVPVKQWKADVLALAQGSQPAESLNSELERRHPFGYGLNTADTLLALLNARGREVMPYVRANLKAIGQSWLAPGTEPFVKLAAREGWWDLWSAAIRVSHNDKLFHAAVAELLDDRKLAEHERMDRLRALAGVSAEWNWPGFGLARVHALEDDLAARLYGRYPQLVRGPYRPHVAPRWWHGFPKLLAAAQQAGDEELIDLLASRYATRSRSRYAYYAPQGLDELMATADSLGDYYQAIRDNDHVDFARRAANVLTQIPAYSIYDYTQLLKTNKLARLLFVRSFDAYLAVPPAVRDLVEGSDIHVQMLAYRVLAQDDDRARQLAVATLDILIGTLMRPLHRKTRMAAFGALQNAARGDAEVARMVLDRARESLRLPDKNYPKEELIGLIGGILYYRPELRQANERPIVFGLEEALV